MAGDHQQLLDVYGGRKRALEEDDEDDNDEEEDAGSSYRRMANSSSAAVKRARRHHWQPKYESEFGLVAIEKDHATGDVVLAMCGFCKAFGREGKFEQLLAADESASAAAPAADGKKRRRRSLTTTKFFRAFRVDNIRSHLQGAHPRRWAEFEMLPKQEALRARFLQPQGDPPYDALHMVDDDVVLHGAPDADGGYAPPPQLLAAAAAAAAAPQAHQPPPPPSSASLAASVIPPPPVETLPETVLTPASVIATSTSTSTVNGNSSSATQPLAAMHTYPGSSRSAFDYEKHASEQLALDRERFEFEKAKFKKKVELRERELALREKHMAQARALHDERLVQDRVLHEKLVQETQEAALRESSKFLRLAEVLRDAVANAVSGSSSLGTSGSSSV